MATISLNKKLREERIPYFPLIWNGRIENDTTDNSSTVARVLITTVTFLPSCCLVMIGGYRYADQWEGFMKYTVEMGTGTMTYIPSFTKIHSGIQKLMGGGTQRHQTASCSHKPNLIFFSQNKESKLIKLCIWYLQENNGMPSSGSNEK
jgi:hypothetical protein